MFQWTLIVTISGFFTGDCTVVFHEREGYMQELTRKMSKHCIRSALRVSINCYYKSCLPCSCRQSNSSSIVGTPAI